MDNIIRIETAPNTRAARFFVITALPESIKKPLRLLSKEDADEAGCRLAANFLSSKNIRIKEIHLYVHKGCDVMCIIMDSPEEWDKKIDREHKIPLEKSIQGIIFRQIVQQQNPLIKKHTGGVTLEEMDAYLQKNKPKNVDEHGGTVTAIKFDAAKGVLTVKYKGACASGECSSAQERTSSNIEGSMRQAFFPHIRKLEFIA